jgi:coatomer subunit beta'
VDEQGVEDAFELLYEISECVRTRIWVGNCFIYNNLAWGLNYYVGGEVSCNLHGTIWHLHGQLLLDMQWLSIIH